MPLLLAMSPQPREVRSSKVAFQNTRQAFPSTPGLVLPAIPCVPRANAEPLAAKRGFELKPGYLSWPLLLVFWFGVFFFLFFFKVP